MTIPKKAIEENFHVYFAVQDGPSRKSVDETLVFEQYFIVVLFLIALSTVCFNFLVHPRIILRI